MNRPDVASRADFFQAIFITNVPVNPAIHGCAVLSAGIIMNNDQLIVTRLKRITIPSKSPGPASAWPHLPNSNFHSTQSERNVNI